MSNLTLNIIIGTATAIIGLLAFVNEFPERKSLNFFKSIVTKLIIFVLCSIIILWASIKKDNLAEAQSKSDKTVAKKEQDKRDSENRKLNDQSNAKIVTAFITALAEYNLKYDASQKAIIKLVRDSAKRETKITYGNHPELEVDDIQLKRMNGDTIMFTINFTSKQAASYHTTVVSYTAWSHSQPPFHFIPDASHFFINDIMIPTDKALSIPSTVSGKIKVKEDLIFFFLFVGHYSDADGKQFSFQVMDSYNLASKEFGAVTEPAYGELKKLFNAHGVSF